jgi:inhibitor of KinA sporulation pathway (predicted exonuclease)
MLLRRRRTTKEIDMTRLRTDRALALDLELTCWESAPPPGQQPEIIEIGIVEIDTSGPEIINAARYLVRPRTSEISDYCERLTGLTRLEVKQDGRRLSEVLRTIENVFAPTHKVLLTWGNDWRAIENACREEVFATAIGSRSLLAYVRLNPFPPENVVNLGALVSLWSGADRRVGMYEAMAAAGVAPEGRQHRAFDDAFNLARLFCRYVERFRDLAPAGHRAGNGAPRPPAPGESESGEQRGSRLSRRAHELEIPHADPQIAPLRVYVDIWGDRRVMRLLPSDPSEPVAIGMEQAPALAAWLNERTRISAIEAVIPRADGEYVMQRDENESDDEYRERAVLLGARIGEKKT